MDGVGAALALLQSHVQQQHHQQYNVSNTGQQPGHPYQPRIRPIGTDSSYSSSPWPPWPLLTPSPEGLLPNTTNMFVENPENFSVSVPGRFHGDASSSYLELEDSWSFGAIMGLIFSAVVLIITVIGNVCVVVAVYQSKALQAPQNKLIVSLAVADLLVGLVVMPFAAITDFAGKWILGSVPCDIYAVLDVCLCTSSILHLVAIAIDRYLSITNMRYIQGRSVLMMYAAIALIWVLSLLLSVTPVFGWRDSQYEERILRGECLISQDVSFQIVATTVAFYGPLVVILLLYGLIYQRTRSRVRKRIETTLNSTLHEIGRIVVAKDDASSHHAAGGSTPTTPTSTPTTPIPVRITATFYNGTWRSRLKLPRRLRGTPGHSPRPSRKRQRPSLLNSIEGLHLGTPRSQRSRGGSSTQTVESDEPCLDEPTMVDSARCAVPLQQFANGQGQPLITTNNGSLAKLTKKSSNSISARHQVLLRREKKAATTLAIITLSFVVCWLPFFVWAVVKPICQDACSLSHFWEAFFLWLGYANSTLNPLIYTIFSPDFRAAFKKMFRLDKR